MVQHSILNLSHPYLKFQASLSLILSQSDTQIIYGPGIDNGIGPCVDSSWTGIFKNKSVVYGKHIRFATPILILIYQKC